MFDPIQIEADAQKAKTLRHNAQLRRKNALAAFSAEMLAVDKMLAEASQLESSGTQAALERAKFVSIDNRQLQQKLGEAERERDKWKVEAAHFNQLPTG